MRQRIDVKCRNWAGVFTVEDLGLPKTPFNQQLVEDFNEWLWDTTVELFWEDVDALATEHAPHATGWHQEGMSGGWLIVEWPTPQLPEELPMLRTIAEEAERLRKHVEQAVAYYAGTDFRYEAIDRFADFVASQIHFGEYRLSMLDEALQAYRAAQKGQVSGDASGARPNECEAEAG